MIIDFLTTYSWVLWVALILIFIIIEVSTVEFTFLMLAVGSVGGLIAGLLGAPLWAQILIAGVLSLILLFMVRPALHRALRKGADATPTNVAALLGIGGTVMNDFVEGQGHVKLANGETWTARLSQAAPGSLVDTGDRVVVTAIEGATAVVVPAERTAS